MDAIAERVAKLYHLTDEELRNIIADEREAGRAWGQVAEAARTLLTLRTGRTT